MGGLWGTEEAAGELKRLLDVLKRAAGCRLTKTTKEPGVFRIPRLRTSERHQRWPSHWPSLPGPPRVGIKRGQLRTGGPRSALLRASIHRQPPQTARCSPIRCEACELFCVGHACFVRRSPAPRSAPHLVAASATAQLLPPRAGVRSGTGKS